MGEPISLACTSEDEWLETRKKYLGASEAAAALSLSPWQSPLSVYLSKIGEGVPWEGSERSCWGQLLEPVVADEYAARENRVLADLGRTTILVSSEIPFASATLDRLDVTTAKGKWANICEADGIVEVKCVDPRNMKSWSDEELPDHYAIQGHHQLLVTGLPVVTFAVLVGGNELRTWTIERDESLLADLAEAEAAFWHLVETRQAPDIDGSTASTDAIKHRFATSEPGSIAILDDFQVSIWKDLLREKEVLKRQELEVARLENELKVALGEKEVATDQAGTVLATWKQSTSSRFDTTAFRTSCPQMYEDYKTESSTRRFLLKGSK